MSAGAAGMAGGGLLSGIGALEQGSQTAAALKYQATVQTNNANEALEAASLNANRSSIMAAKTIGAAKAGYGSSGVTSDSGSVAAVLGASAANAELDRQNILYGGQIRAINSENQAHMDEVGAANATSASYLKAFAGVTGGIGGAFMNSASLSGSDEISDEGSDEVNAGSDMENVDPDEMNISAGMTA